MPGKFKYPVLFHPDEELMGSFEDGDPRYLITKKDLPGFGVEVKLIMIDRRMTPPRRDIITLRSLSYSDAVAKVRTVYEKEVGITDED